MAELWPTLKGFLEFLFGTFGPVGGLLCLCVIWLAVENRSLKKRVEALSDQLIEDGRDATDKLLEMSASKFMNEAETSQALSKLAAALTPAGRRK